MARGAGGNGPRVSGAVGGAGVDKQDCEVTIEGNMLYVKGEKRFERTDRDSTCHVMEHIYGVFERVITLPADVDPDRAETSRENGVLTVHLPRLGSGKGQPIPCRIDSRIAAHPCKTAPRRLTGMFSA